MERLKSFLKEEEGASAVEYGLLVALIAAVIVLTVQALGSKVLSGFTKVEAALP
jgi:pilus assembly protein Flp/PilA